MKKYRLETSKYEGFLPNYLIDYDGMTTVPTKNENEYAVYPGDEDCHVTLVMIPEEFKDFLMKEIKQPMSAIEAYNLAELQRHDLKSSCDDEEWFLEGFKRGEENERLKHEPKQTFEEYAKSSGRAPCDLGYDLLKEGWKACDKSRGYDE